MFELELGAIHNTKIMETPIDNNPVTGTDRKRTDILVLSGIWNSYCAHGGNSHVNA